MLEATKTGLFSGRYEIAVDGCPAATWAPSGWRSGGTLHMNGADYRVSGNVWGTRYAMLDGAGRQLADADRVGRKRWTVSADGHTYHLERRSVWRDGGPALR